MRSDKLNKSSGKFGDLDFVLNAKDIAFASGRYQNLVRSGAMTSLSVNDATVDAGITLVKNYEYVSAWTCDAASALTLPAAEEGVMVTWAQEALADGAYAAVFTCASGDTFEPYQEVHIGTGIPALQDSSVAADSVLTITQAATNGGWGAIGSTLMFYCKNDGEWLVRVDSISAGTGATGTIAFS